MNERARPERLTQNRVDLVSDLDTEIETLKQRLARIRDLKQAMILEQLTGRTRLV